MTDLDHIIRDKYDGDASRVTEEDRRRLAEGWPVAYIIGWIPFLGLRIYLDHSPLIPRPETEWWTELLMQHIQSTTIYGSAFQVLDLCSGSGAIGLSLLHAIPNAHIHFAEREENLLYTIEKNIELNHLDASRATLSAGDLFENVPKVQFNLIACNPPYIPSERVLDASVTSFEPAVALFSGTDGLDLIRRIAQEVPTHIKTGGELWLEADISNIEEARNLLISHGATEAVIREDLYGRPRLVIAYY